MNKREKRAYFEGWYLKQQNEDGVIALIPSFHIEQNGMHNAYLQVITKEGAWVERFPAKEFEIDQKRHSLRIGKTLFTKTGVCLDLEGEKITLKGNLQYKKLVKPTHDVMGPFRFFPTPCKHSVFSIQHHVNGIISLNGREFSFQNGIGYIEGDRGHSFPKHYLWTQGMDKKISIMLSIAELPFFKKKFIGCLGIIWIAGKQYNIATYLGARVLWFGAQEAIVKQRELILRVKLLKGESQILKAPKKGMMCEHIKEHADCQVRYQLYFNKLLLFDWVSRHAGFEHR